MPGDGLDGVTIETVTGSTLHGIATIIKQVAGETEFVTATTTIGAGTYTQQDTAVETVTVTETVASGGIPTERSKRSNKDRRSHPAVPTGAASHAGAMRHRRHHVAAAAAAEQAQPLQKRLEVCPPRPKQLNQVGYEFTESTWDYIVQYACGFEVEGYIEGVVATEFTTVELGE